MQKYHTQILFFITINLTLLFGYGCRNTKKHLAEINKATLQAIKNTDNSVLKHGSSFTINRPENELRERLLDAQDLPSCNKTKTFADSADLKDGLKLNLNEALQVAASYSREYQDQKELVFKEALNLVNSNDTFASSFAGIWSGIINNDSTKTELSNNFSLKWQKRLKNGMRLSSKLAFDLANLLSPNRSSANGILFDSTISVPLMAGSGKKVVMEPIIQAERNLLYSLYSFEYFRQNFAIRISSEYMGVLRQLNQVKNSDDNYQSLIVSSNRARRLADFGRIAEVEVAESKQDELKARDNWLSAKQNYQSRLDSFKLSLGVSPDAEIELDYQELDKQTISLQSLTKNDNKNEQESTAKEDNPLQMDEKKAIGIALEKRCDLKVSLGSISDAQRKLWISKDALRSTLNLIGDATYGGSAVIGANNAQLEPKHGKYSLGMDLSLPWEKCAEQINYRKSLIALAGKIRNQEKLEDRIKLQVRNSLRKLASAKISITIQTQATKLALKRVKNTTLLLNMGRSQIRDVLFAQGSLLSVQNKFTAALIDYRIAELELQRDMGILQVNKQGLLKVDLPNE